MQVLSLFVVVVLFYASLYSCFEIPLFSLCSENNTLPWITWCEYNNPTIVPLPFNVTVDYSSPVPILCNSSNIYDDCFMMTRIVAIDSGGGPELYFFATDGCLYTVALGNTVRLVCNTTKNGVPNLNTLVTDSGVSCVVGAIDNIAYYNCFYPNGGQINSYWTEDETIIDQFMVPLTSFSPTAILVVSALYNTSGYSLSFHVLDERINFNNFGYLGVWQILDTEGMELDFDVTTLNSYSNFNSSITEQNNILLIRNGLSVNFIILSNASIQLPLASISIGMGSPNITTYYKIENEIDVVSLWAEPTPRFQNEDNSTFPSSLLWLVIGQTTTTNGSSLNMIAFTEYLNFPNIEPVVNSTSRPFLSYPLPEPASIFKSRFVGRYDNIDNEFYNIENAQLNVQHNEFYIAMKRSMAILSVQIYQYTQHELLIDTLNTLTYAGNFKSVFISHNGQHIFATTDRTQWELEGMVRFYNICDTLQNSDNQTILQFLEPYAPQCDEGYRMPTFMDFIQYAGVCLSLIQCPSFSKLVISQIPRGYYTKNTFLLEQCEPGTFCVSGMQQTCPKGFICPEYGMSVPIRCSFNEDYDTTCYGDGLTQPLPCPEGMSCPTPYMPGFPSPPGYCAPIATRTHFELCTLGDYCNLGMGCNSTNILCPLGTYCNDPEEMYPTICSCSVSNCSYCKPGSWEEELCPAGYYCQGPNTIQPCDDMQYCPPGSVSGDNKCPGGYYCPKPDQKILCPHGSYCPQGSVAPKKCAFFSVCSPGSSQQKGNYGMPLFGALILLVLFGAWKGYLYYRSKHPRKPAPIVPEKAPLLFTPAEEGLQEKTFCIDIEFNALGLTIGDKKVLSGVTGTVHHKRVTAVMGPSGAGKTTFLTTLADKVSTGKVSGNIYINGKKGSLGQYKEIVGFVPQEDIMLRQMTVEENLLFAARTRLPAGMSDTLRTKQVNSIIEVLGLKDVRESLIGDEVTRGVSGGQRKRVNIGMELVADPTVLFLDEPTSGLDSTSSREVLAALRKIAELGITIVTVIHQPRYEIFTMFHDVLLLGKGGRTVYLGDSGKALEYFEKLGFVCPPLVNPPDFFLDVISGEVPREGYPEFTPFELFDLWEQNKKEYATGTSQEHAINNEYEVQPTSRFKCMSSEEKITYRRIPGFFSQLWYFFVRALIQQVRNIPALLLDMFLVAASGLFLGIIFAKASYQGPPPQAACDRLMVQELIERCLFPADDPIGTIASLTCLSVSLTAVASSLRVFGNEKVVYWREASWGLDTLAYFLGKDLANIPSMLFQPLVFLAVYCTVVSTQAPFLSVYLIILIVQFTSVGIGYLVSIMISSSLSQLVGVVFVLVSMMFSGARPTLSELSKMIFPLNIMANFSFIRWAQEGFYLTEIKEYEKVFSVQSGMDIWSYKFSNYHRDIGMTVMLGLVFRLVALFLLYVMDRHKKK